MSDTAISGFGKPKFGGQSTFVKTGKVVKGENFIRILPPLGNLRESGEWRKYWTTHWGYSGVNPRDASKRISRPFRCILDKDRRSGMVRQDCPACTFYEELKAKAKEHEAKLTTSGISEDEVKTAMEPLTQQLQDFRAESKHYVNVVYKDGKVGDFKLNHKDHMSRIITLIEGTSDSPNSGLIKGQNIDPFDPGQGVWFKITRNGNGVTPLDTVEVEDEWVEANGRKLRDIKLAPLSDEIATKALTECRSLDTLGGYTLSYNQIAELVKCSGDPEAVDRIFGLNQPRDPALTNLNRTAPPETGAAPPSAGGPGTATTPPETFTVNGKVVSKTDYDRYQVVMAKKKNEAEAKVQAEAAAKEKARAAAAAVKAASEKVSEPTVPQSGVVDTINMSDDDFLKTLG